MRSYVHDTVVASCDSHGDYSQAVISSGYGEIRSRCPVCRHLDEMADYLSRYPFMDFPSWAGGGTSISDGYMGRILADGKNYILSCPSRALTVAVNASLHSSSGSVGYVRVNEAMAALSAGKLSRQTLDSAYHQAETLIYSTGLMVSEQWVGEVVRAIELRPGKKTIILTEWLLPQLREAIGPAANAKLSSHGFFFVLTRAETLR